MKKAISIIAVILIAATLFTANVFAIDKPVNASLGALGANTLLASAAKTNAGILNDAFKWSSGSATVAVDLFLKNNAGTQISNKVRFDTNWVGDNVYHQIPYKSGIIIQAGQPVYMYGEQGSLSAKTLIGTARFN
jgi:hypothetical protein